MYPKIAGEPAIKAVADTTTLADAIATSVIIFVSPCQEFDVLVFPQSSGAPPPPP